MFKRLSNALLAAAASIVVLACAIPATTLDAQWVNPDDAGRKAVRNVLVMGAVRDATNRRLFEDRMVASLTAAGVKAVPSYKFIPEAGPVSEERLRRAVAEAGVSHAMVTRISNVSTQVSVSPGMVMGPGWGPGWGPAGGPGWGGGWGGFSRLSQLDVGDDNSDASDDNAERPCRHAPVRREECRGAVVGGHDHIAWFRLRPADHRSVCPADHHDDDERRRDLTPARSAAGIGIKGPFPRRQAIPPDRLWRQRGRRFGTGAPLALVAASRALPPGDYCATVVPSCLLVSSFA